jgi:hypothetical protein
VLESDGLVPSLSSAHQPLLVALRWRQKCRSRSLVGRHCIVMLLLYPMFEVLVQYCTLSGTGGKTSVAGCTLLTKQNTNQCGNPRHTQGQGSDRPHAATNSSYEMVLATNSLVCSPSCCPVFRVMFCFFFLRASHSHSTTLPLCQSRASVFPEVCDEFEDLRLSGVADWGAPAVSRLQP